MRLRYADCRTVAHQGTVEASYFDAGRASNVEDGAGIVRGVRGRDHKQQRPEAPHRRRASHHQRLPIARFASPIVVVLALVGYSWIGAWPSWGAFEQLRHECRDAQTPASVLQGR